MRRTPRIAEVGGVYSFVVADGRIGACQVLARKRTSAGEQAEVAALDWLGTRPPTPQEISRAKIVRQWFAEIGELPARLLLPALLPWWFEHVATVAPLETFAAECTSHGGGWRALAAAYDQARFESEKRRRWERDPGEVTLETGAGPRTVTRDLSSISLEAGADFAALAQIHSLTEILFSGNDDALFGAVAKLKLMRLTLKAHGRRAIDLSKSCLRSLTLEIGKSPLVLKAPPELNSLTLIGRADLVTVEGIRPGMPFHLELSHARIGPPPHGLEKVQSVSLTGLRDTDAKALAEYTDLRELTLRGAPGRLIDASGLSALGSLRHFALRELYALDGPRWPTDWPRLESAELHGLRKRDVPALTRSLGDVPSVRLTGARTDAWIAANLSNPFREWETDAPAFGRAACGAWVKAKTAAGRLGARPKKTDAEEVLHALVATLNKLDAKTDIDTVRREEAGLAFSALATELGVTAAQADKWFDAWRDF